MRAFIYCRVSTKEQSSQDHYSLDNQEQRCRDYIKMKGWQLLKVRKDVASGKNDQRDGFSDLRSAITQGHVDVVMVYRLDRLSRNVRDIYDFLDTIKNKGVAFVSVTEGFDTTTAMGRAMLGVAAVFAQLTREMISENTKDGLLRRREAGLYGGDPHKAYGYRFCAETKRLAIDEKEAPVVRQIWDWYTEHKWGSGKITQMLNLQGVPAKLGGEWNTTTIRKMMSNPLWSGQLRVEDKIVPGQHPAIISREQFELAQEIRAGHKQYANASQQSKYLLSGLARCGQCGKRLTAHTVLQGKEKKPYISYHHPHDWGRNGCPGIYKSISKLDKAVVEQIGLLSRSGILEQAVNSDVIDRLKDQNAPKVGERDKILLELQGMEERFTKWADRLDSGKIDEEQFEQQNSRLLTQKAQLQERLSALQSELGQTEHIELTLTEVRKVLQEFPTVWEALEHEERREMLRLLIEELRVYRTHIELKLLFLDLVEVSFGTAKTKRTGKASAPELDASSTSNNAPAALPKRRKKANADAHDS